MNNQYTTLSEAVNHLRERGFDKHFRISEKGELVDNGETRYKPEQVKLVEFHRFEGTSDPADMSIVYAIETDTGEKGTVVDSFGAKGTETISDFMNKVEQGQYED